MTGILVYENRHIALITPTERMNALAVAKFRQVCNSLFERGSTHFIIDLSQTPVIDSAGLAVLVYVFKRCRQVGGSMQLAQTMSPATQRVLHLTRFDLIFETIAQHEIERLLPIAA